jgi:hypothetical protein
MKEFLGVSESEESAYNTEKGAEIKKKINDKVIELHLKDPVGCSLVNYSLHANSSNSIYQLVVGLFINSLVIFFIFYITF